MFKHILVFVLIFHLFGFLGCNRNQSQVVDSSVRRPFATPINPASTGSISGTIKFTGAPPTRIPIDMDQDPACAIAGKGPNLSEAIIVNNGHLKNVFIYIKTGLEEYSIPQPAQPAALDQIGCRYHPHVLGMVAGQTLRILNSDNAEHNVHPMAKNNPQWNESQLPHGDPKERTFKNTELLLPVTCNQHPWMKMYINVVSNPFFSVSDEDGNFGIKGLPPGAYTLAAVHEKLGTQEMKVTVTPRQNQTANFTFKPY